MPSLKGMNAFLLTDAFLPVSPYSPLTGEDIFVCLSIHLDNGPQDEAEIKNIID